MTTPQPPLPPMNPVISSQRIFLRPCSIPPLRTQPTQFRVSLLPQRTGSQRIHHTHKQRRDANCILSDNRVLYFGICPQQHFFYLVTPTQRIRRSNAMPSPLGIHSHGYCVVTASNPIVLIDFTRNEVDGGVRIMPILHLAGENAMMTRVKILHVRAVRTSRSAPIDQYHIMFATNEGEPGSKVFRATLLRTSGCRVLLGAIKTCAMAVDRRVAGTTLMSIFDIRVRHGEHRAL